MSHFLDHPEIQRLFQDLVSTLLGESDRGAVLVGAAYVDEHLTGLFEAVFRDDVSKRRRRTLLDYPGALSGFSAKADVAFALRLIPREVHSALHALRRLRNELAHQPSSFSLRERGSEVRKIFALGDGLPGAVQHSALEMMLETKFAAAQEAVRKLEEENPDWELGGMSSKADFVEFLQQNPDTMGLLENQAPRWELVVGLSILCGLIVHHRDRAVATLGPDLLLSSSRLVRISPGVQ